MVAIDLAGLCAQPEDVDGRRDFSTPAPFTQDFNQMMHAAVLTFAAHALQVELASVPTFNFGCKFDRNCPFDFIEQFPGSRTCDLTVMSGPVGSSGGTPTQIAISTPVRCLHVRRMACFKRALLIVCLRLESGAASLSQHCSYSTRLPTHKERACNWIDRSWDGRESGSDATPGLFRCKSQTVWSNARRGCHVEHESEEGSYQERQAASQESAR